MHARIVMTIKVHIRMQITMMRTRDQCVDDGDSRLDMSRTIMMIAYTWNHVYIQNADAMGGAWGSSRVGECHATANNMRDRAKQICLVQSCVK